MREGKFKNYFWLNSLAYNFIELEKARLLDRLAGNRLVISSFDSGPLVLSSEETEMGWKVIGELAVSPPLNNTDIPNDNCFDEWWVFEAFDPSIEIEPFVNYRGFSLMTEEELKDSPPSHWDRELVESKSNLINRFWQQLLKCSPLAYFAVGDSFNFATKDMELFEAVRSSVQKIESRSK